MFDPDGEELIITEIGPDWASQITSINEMWEAETNFFSDIDFMDQSPTGRII